MNLYLISQDENDGYDTYDSAVVAANTADEARNIHPGDMNYDAAEASGIAYNKWSYHLASWAKHPRNVTVKFLGEAAPGISGVVCASFNAG